MRFHLTPTQAKIIIGIAAYLIGVIIVLGFIAVSTAQDNDDEI